MALVSALHSAHAPAAQAPAPRRADRRTPPRASTRTVATVAAGVLVAILAGVLVAALAALAVVVSGGPASAHSSLVASTPAAGDTVPGDVERLTLVFDTGLLAGAGEVRVVDPSGDEVTTGEPGVLGDTLQVRMALAEAGRHEVAYRVTGADGHVVEGSYAFEVAAAADEAAPAGSATTAPAAPAASAGSAGSAGSVTAAPASGGAGGSPSWLPWAVVAGAIVLAFAADRRRTPSSPRA